MKNEILYSAITDKYLAPTRRPRTDCVGIELEFPVVNLRRAAVDYSVVHTATQEFVQHFGFTDTLTDDEGQIYSASNPQNGDNLSFDCSYNTLELSFGKESDINLLHKRFELYFTFLQTVFQQDAHILTGMGINPYRAYNLREPIPNERYRMLFHHLSSYEKYPGHAFHAFPDFGLFSCASQVQLDVEEEKIVPVLQVFSKLEPLKSLLFSNSPLDTESGRLLCSRDYLWKNSLHGINPRNVDGYSPMPQTNDDLVSYIAGMSLYCADRGGVTIHFAPIPLEAYFSADSIEGEYWDGERFATVRFTPQIDDLKYLRSFKFEDLTYRGTIEFRSVCEQPASDSMTVAAFHAGIMERIEETNEVLTKHSALNLTDPVWRDQFNRTGVPEGLDRTMVSNLLNSVLDSAKAGLVKRGYGEEHFLDPLYARAERLQNPAQTMLEGVERGETVEYYIQEFARI